MNKIKPFLDENFLLQNQFAEQLYHEFAAPQPIIDYHNHLPPDQIANQKQFETITEVWLKGDHYKWRAMRANGISEDYITGAASDKEKFMKWAETVPYTMRNPLYHWTHLELQRYFGIEELLSPKTAEKIYEKTCGALQDQTFNAPGLLQKMKVEVVCTTDEPTDSLAFHKKHRESSSDLKMLPTFRPDKLLTIGSATFKETFSKLEKITDKEINNFDDFLSALENRIDFFHALGGRLADHGLAQLPKEDFSRKVVEAIFRKEKNKEAIDSSMVKIFQSAVLYELAKMYHARGWTMQFHLGAIRNNNSRLLHLVGADVGCDSIGDYEQATALSAFLNRLDRKNQLTKTILYNLNPRDNEVFATMAGNFNDGSLSGKIQWGSAWWFLDQKDGMEKQIDALSNMGLLSQFVGMLTDSRSFLSFPRHEYFRRILCNRIGQDVQNGELPNDIEWLGKIVADISYGNAKRYFDF